MTNKSLTPDEPVDAPIYREFLYIETGSRQLTKVPDLWERYTKAIYREHYEPIEDER